MTVADFILGLLLGIAAVVGLSLLVGAMHGQVLLVGLLEWVIILPLGGYFWRKDRYLVLVGMCLVGGLVFLLLAACYGLVYRGRF